VFPCAAERLEPDFSQPQGLNPTGIAAAGLAPLQQRQAVGGQALAADSFRGSSCSGSAAPVFPKFASISVGLGAASSSGSSPSVDVSVDADGIARLVASAPPAAFDPAAAKVLPAAGWPAAPLPSAAAAAVAAAAGAAAAATPTLAVAAPPGLECSGCNGPGGPRTEAARSPVQAAGSTRTGGAGGSGGGSRSTAAVAVPASAAAVAKPEIVRHSGAEGVSLAEQVRTALATSAARAAADGGKADIVPKVFVELTGHCDETSALEVSSGEVTLCGSVGDAGAKARLALPGIRVTSGGALYLRNLDICALEDNRVQAGLLQCSECLITSRGGCGVLCLQRARVFLRDCEVTRCMRSGIGVNGKNTEIDLQGCLVSHNNFSGIGVNHQARSITLRGNRILANGYHGVWLNVGVVVQWLGGEISGNRLSDKDGLGTLQGFVSNHKEKESAALQEFAARGEGSPAAAAHVKA